MALSVIFFHGLDRLRDFVDYRNIQFTSETKRDGHLSFLDILMQRARAHCDQNNLRNELDFLKVTFRQKDYSDPKIRRALNPPTRVPPPKAKPNAVAFVPHVLSIFNRISRVLSRNNKSVCLPPKKISSFLRPVKDDFGLRTRGAHNTPSECGHAYIGQRGHSVDIRMKEHRQHIQLDHSDKSAVAGHSIQLHNTSFLSNLQAYGSDHPERH
jgi:hypothetical protein